MNYTTPIDKKILSFFWPQQIANFSSSCNGSIRVYESFGKRYVEAGGLMQSGAFLEWMYDRAFRKLNTYKKRNSFRRILVLGLGAGSVAKVLSRRYPGSEINGIDIDPKMVEAGKMYFNLGHVRNLKIHITDAKKFIDDSRGIYDLIFVDVYQGDMVPPELETENFLRSLVAHLAHEGCLIFNRLYDQRHISEANFFLDKLKKMFNDVISIKVASNLFIRLNSKTDF